jgi:hypothetical protein
MVDQWNNGGRQWTNDAGGGSRVTATIISNAKASRWSGKNAESMGEYGRLDWEGWFGQKGWVGVDIVVVKFGGDIFEG